jgi:hypothetical protein
MRELPWYDILANAYGLFILTYIFDQISILALRASALLLSSIPNMDSSRSVTMKIFWYVPNHCFSDKPLYSSGFIDPQRFGYRRQALRVMRRMPQDHLRHALQMHAS